MSVSATQGGHNEHVYAATPRLGQEVVALRFYDLAPSLVDVFFLHYADTHSAAATVICVKQEGMILRRNFPSGFAAALFGLREITTQPANRC